MIARFTNLILVVIGIATGVLSYKLSSDDGQADIGAYHVQPGRCASVERRLGRTKYDYFFHSDPTITSFTPGTPSNPSPPPPPSNGEAGSGIEQMDATALCSFNPELTQGYGGGFDEMKLYLVYSRCLYGTETMRVLCGTTNAHGKPIASYNVVQATCPAGTKCKNFCATMQNPSLTSPFAAKQVQLAQCLSIDQWQKLTDMYKPKSPPSLSNAAPGGGGNRADAKVDPKVVEKVPEGDPTKDPMHVDKDGTIAGKVFFPAHASPKTDDKAPSTPPSKKEEQEPAPSPQRDAQQGKKPITVGHLQVGAGSAPKPDPKKPEPPAAANPKGDFGPLAAGHGHTNPILPLEPSGQNPQRLLERQKAPTEMGF
ncbi:hypothetical protein NDA18_000808 [Ustilago nuda]|nr:hypothetical protein NDA18_002906 [Ustilago nuda]KAJ1035212.1 hypothetical protein NDA18_000808 [Ustilago nuda]